MYKTVKNFIKSWANAYLADIFSHVHDQGTFRILLYKTNLKIATLPPEWNYRLDLYREDTVILQNREKLHEYLQSQKQPTN